jgi:hypothetical protein
MVDFSIPCCGKYLFSKTGNRISFELVLVIFKSLKFHAITQQNSSDQHFLLFQHLVVKSKKLAQLLDD